MVRVIDINKVKVACQECSLAQLCLPASLDAGDMQRLDKLIQARTSYQRGEIISSKGQPMHALYAVRSGGVKSYVMGDRGEAQIVGFHLPGELIGLDAIATGVYKTTTEALAPTSVCQVPFDSIEKLSRDLPSLNYHLWRIMSKEISREGEALQLLNGKRSAARLASFLLSLSERYHERHLSESEFNLSMTRHEIANYLGMAVETISRTLTVFQNQSLVEIQGKYVRIIDFAGLHEIAGHPAAPSISRDRQRHG